MSQHIWNNMAFNSDDEMRLAQEIPSVYLDRWSDAGHVAEAILDSDWLAAHDRDVAASILEEMGTQWGDDQYIRHYLLGEARFIRAGGRK